MRADIIALDGRNLLWRTADAYSRLSVEIEGENIPTGGLYGFLSCALRIHSAYRGRVVVAWEGRDNFRFKLFPDYKAKRTPKTETERQAYFDQISELAETEVRLRELLGAMGVHQFEGVGCEADDVLGRLSTLGSDDRRVVIYSADSDVHQLVRDSVTVVAPGRGSSGDRTFDAPAVIEKHGVRPDQLADLKALSGDTSDGIPGIRGVGAKTAAILIGHYGTLEGVLEAAAKEDPDWPSTPRYRGLVAEGAEEAKLFQRLTRIRLAKPWLHIPGERAQRRVVELLRRYKIRSLQAPAELHGLMTMGRKSRSAG